MDDKYILIQSQKSLKFLKQEIDKLGGFFNGIGYAFPIRSRESISSVFSNLPPKTVKIVELPLIAKTFDQYRISHKTDWYRTELRNKKKELLLEQSRLDISDLSEKEIESIDFLNRDQKDKIIRLFHEIEELQKNIDWSEAIEKKIPDLNHSSVGIKFLTDLPLNYLECDASPKPRLLYWVEKDGTKQPFLHKEVVGMLVAAGGAGKTHLSSLLALSVVTGIPFLKIFEIEKPGAVCFIVGENSDEDMHRLLRKTRKSMDLLLKENGQLPEHQRFSLHSPNPFTQAASRLAIFSVHGKNARFIDDHGNVTPFFLNLIQDLKEKEPKDGWQLIILDPISRFSGLDAEKDNAVATAFIACVERISNELIGKPTVLLTHHKPKSAVASNNSDQTAARGASGITDGVRWQANLDKNNNGDLTLRVVKSNFTAYPGEVQLVKDKNGIHQLDHVFLDEDRTVKKNRK